MVDQKKRGRKDIAKGLGDTPFLGNFGGMGIMVLLVSS